MSSTATNLPIFVGGEPVCIHCKGVLADFGFEKGERLWCTMHKPEGTVNLLTKYERKQRFREIKENARFYKPNNP